MKGSAKARVVIAAPAKAEDRLGKDSEWTICGGIGISFLEYNPSCHCEEARRSNLFVTGIIMRLLRYARNDRQLNLISRQ